MTRLLGPAPLALLVAVLLIAGCGEPPRGTPLLSGAASPLDALRDRDQPVGPLAVLPSNPRSFTDARGRRAVYLTGSHTWNNVQDWGAPDPEHPFDYDAYLEALQRYGHNFIRLWFWEQATWVPWTEERVSIGPSLYLRTGPGRARDGGLRFDLARFNPEYFRRLRQRVEAAGRRKNSGNPWNGHPFNRENNVNAIDGDVDGDGEGKEVPTLSRQAASGGDDLDVPRRQGGQRVALREPSRLGRPPRQ